MLKTGDKKSKSLQLCCPTEIQIASDLFLVKFGNIFKFGTYGNMSNITFENYVKLSDDVQLILQLFSKVLKKLNNLEPN